MLISAAAPAEKVLVFMNPAVTVKENYEFRRIYRKGKSAVSPQLVIYCQRNRRGLSRLGVSVSTKLGGAVVRNRVRRRIREIYRLNKPKMVPGYDIIVVARVRAVETGYQKLESTYLRLLRQLNLLREDPSCRAILRVIRFYQASVSPLFPPRCRYIPTCSEYALQAVEKYGPLRGGFMALRRFLRCNPFHKGGYDPVP